MKYLKGIGVAVVVIFWTLGIDWLFGSESLGATFQFCAVAILVLVALIAAFIWLVKRYGRPDSGTDRSLRDDLDEP